MKGDNDLEEAVAFSLNLTEIKKMRANGEEHHFQDYGLINQRNVIQIDMDSFNIIQGLKILDFTLLLTTLDYNTHTKIIAFVI